MDVNAVSSGASAVNNYSAPAATDNSKAAAVNPTAETEETTQNEAAVYESSGKSDKVYKPDADKIRQLMAESDKQVANFRKLVEGLFNKQAQKSNDAFGFITGAGSSDRMIEIDDETRAAAQKEIEEGGYYSVDETAKRILDFAVALSGGDPSKISELKKAVQAGFGAAGEEWGSKMPEITNKTYEAVMNGFDEWEKAGSSDAITLLAKKAE